MAPRSEVPDTSVFLELIWDPRRAKRFRRSVSSGRVWLSSVVAFELFAGSRDAEDAKSIRAIVNAMKRDNRLLIPTHDDWIFAAQLIARYSRLHGDVEARPHLADALIVVSAARLRGGTVITKNVRHMENWAELARTMGRRASVDAYES